MMMLAQLLLTAAFASDAQVAAVALPPRLEFHLFSAEGQPGKVSSNMNLDVSRFGGRTLFCVRCPKGEMPEPWHNTPDGVPPSSFSDVRTCFVVEPGERYVYAYVGWDIDPIEGEVTIGRDDALTVRELRVQPFRRTQSLEIHLMRPDSTAISHDVQVNLESLTTGLTLFRAELTPSDLQFKNPYPVGRYRLRVETEDLRWHWNCGQGPPPKPAPFGDWVETIELTADEPLAIESFFWRGGKLRLAIDFPEGMKPPTEQWEKQFSPGLLPREFHWLGLASRGPGARVTLRPDPEALAPAGGRGMTDVTSWPLRFECAGSTQLQVPAVLPGDEQTSADWIPPGAYIAYIEAREFAPIETKVTIRVDETTSLRVRLTPR